MYGMLYVCIRRLRYGYIVNNKNILKYLDVVIFDKDNSLIFFCVVWLYIIGFNG